MSRPSVLRFGSQPNINPAHNTATTAVQASPPNFSLYNFPVQFPTIARSQTLPTPAMPPTFSWKSFRNLFSSRTNEAENQESTSSSDPPVVSAYVLEPTTDIPTPPNSPPPSESMAISRQPTELVYHPQTVAETAEELKSLDIVVRDYAYPSLTKPAPFSNVPARPHQLTPVPCLFHDPPFALAEIDYRVSTLSPLPINGQKARWLLDMGWLTEKDQGQWRQCDWKALKEYDDRPSDSKPRFYVQKMHKTPMGVKERLANAQRWKAACVNIESHEMHVRRVKREREPSMSDGEVVEIRKKRLRIDGPSPPRSTHPSSPRRKRRKTAALPPAPLKQFPAPLENYDPAQYNIEEIKASQEAMRRWDQARIAAMEANKAPRSPTPELHPGTSSPSPLTPPPSQTGPKRKLGLRRTETLMRF